jgi:hypothetical protein
MKHFIRLELQVHIGSIKVIVEDPDCEFEISIDPFYLTILASPVVSGSQLVVEFTQV